MNNAKPQQLLATVFSVALSIGLLLGLFIGWVLWPVEWQGATLNDLDTAEKAEYLAAVADAFVIYSDPEAAEIAWRRLQGFQPDIQQSFNDAIIYFRDSQQPERAIRISNLGRLASAIGLVPPTLAAIGEPTTEGALMPLANPATTTNNDSTATGATTATTEAGSSGWVRWLLWLLVLLLIGGGLYLLRAFMGDDSQLWLASLRERFQNLRSGTATAPWDNDSLGADEFTDEDYAAGISKRQPLAGRQLVTADDDLSFEDEDDGAWRAPATRYSDTNAQRDNFAAQETATYRRPEQHHQRPGLEDDDLDLDDPDGDLDGEGFIADEDDDSNGRPGRGRLPSRFAVADYDLMDNEEDDEIEAEEDDLDAEASPKGQAQPAILKAGTPAPVAGRSSKLDEPFQDDEDEEDEEEDEVDDTPQRAAPPVVPLARHREPAPAVSAAPTSTPRSRYKILDQHTLQYRVGMPEYDELKAILDPATNKYIGEFGMGVSTKNALAQTAPDQVVALEVWLFDKSDEQNMGQQTRILLSEYAVDHNLEQLFLKERQDNPRPFTAQSGVHFQLESQNLLLDCVLIEVKYAQSGPAKGIFQSVKVEMTVQQKR